MGLRRVDRYMRCSVSAFVVVNGGVGANGVQRGRFIGAI
jgi:hypothetical protein